MPRYVMLVETNPVSPERETEYNDWYSDTHIPDVLKVAGFVAATRYRLADVQLAPGESPTYRYLAIYEIDTVDLDAAVKALAEAAGGGMFISDSLQMEPFPGVSLFEEIAPRVV